MRGERLDEPAYPSLYLPVVDASDGGVNEMTLTVRTAAEPLSSRAAVIAYLPVTAAP